MYKRQVKSTPITVSSVAVAIGSILVGWAFDYFGVEPSMIVSGIALAAFGLGSVLRVSRRVHGEHEAAPAEP